MTETEESIGSYWMQINHLFFKQAYALFSKLEVHPGQMPLIFLLGKEQELSQREITEKLHIKASTVNVSLKRLEQVGIVERKTDEKDKRITRIRLTPQGKEICRIGHQKKAELEEAYTKGFSESEICLLKRFLRQIAANMEEMGEKEVC